MLIYMQSTTGTYVERRCTTARVTATECWADDVLFAVSADRGEGEWRPVGGEPISPLYFED